MLLSCLGTENAHHYSILYRIQYTVYYSIQYTCCLINVFTEVFNFVVTMDGCRRVGVHQLQLVFLTRPYYHIT